MTLRTSGQVYEQVDGWARANHRPHVRREYIRRKVLTICCAAGRADIVEGLLEREAQTKRRCRIVSAGAGPLGKNPGETLVSAS